jgi:UDP-N-acetylmuramoylalanine--D-glutamate ligase
VFAFLGYLTAVLYDYSKVVVGNEYSSNFGNIKYKEEEINHQWSKSLEFEKLFQAYTKRFISPSVTFFSLLRPFYEIRIAEMFVKYKKYFPVFSSCNRNFKVYEKRQNTLWCGECAKCIFVFTILSAFLKEKELISIFGKNLYKDEKLLPMFADVLGFGKIKPFDCVGTFDEAQSSLYLASENFEDTYIVKYFLKKIKNPKLLVEKVFRLNITSTIPERFMLVGVKNVLILGYGKEGKMTEQYLKKYFPKIKITITDKSIDQNYLEKQKDFDVVIKTPGIPKRQVSVPYITATNLFFSQIQNTVIGVTGSKGKSTTSSLIYNIFKEAGKKVRFLGNIGSPMLVALMNPIDKDEIFVLELSSYQLDDIKYSPQIAVVLNLFPEHMDYHGDVEKYYRAKSNIVKFQNRDDYFIYNGNDKRLKVLAAETMVHKLTFTKDFDFKKISSLLKGQHNEENMRAAITVARLFDVSEKKIKKALEKFNPLPHRLECVGNFSGILFIDDAISTTPESTIMALETIPGIETIFLGGEDRGYDFSELERQLRKKKIKNIVLFPDSGGRILKSRKGFNVMETSSMEEAVTFAYKNTSKKATCLLSMASPSYSLWRNFEEKGDQFQFWVKKLSYKTK